MNEIDGAAANVNLKKKQAIVSLERNISDEQIKSLKKPDIRLWTFDEQYDLPGIKFVMSFMKRDRHKRLWQA